MNFNFLIINEHQALTTDRAVALSGLDKLYFPTPWTFADWQTLHEKNHLLIVLVSGERIVGFCLFHFLVADSFGHLLKILIIPDYQKRGCGKILLEKTLNQLRMLGCTQFYLEVEETNCAARDMYLTFDFKIIHKKKDFYGAGRTALIMFKS